MRQRSLDPGTQIARYRVVSLLGAGGMGEVYLARDESLDRSVALKILPPDLVKNDERVRRFVQEAKSASSLNHPHIVTIYEIGEAHIGAGDGAPAEKIQFIAMELVSGHTLKTLIHQEKTDLKTLVRYLAQAADGLAKAHAAGIVHRDLKPENIMVTTDGFAKVVDFGLAKLTESAASGTEGANAPTELGRGTGAGMVLGTVGYMSPEQVQGKQVDHRSDIFSLGCVLYEAATRQRPFQADSDVETLHKILKDRPQPIEEINPEVPGELRRAIRRCLAKSVDQRWQGMKDLALELAELADEFDTLSASSGSGARVSSGAMGEALPSRRTRALVALAFVVGALGLAVGGWSVWRMGGGSSETGPPIETMSMTRLMSSPDIGQFALSPDGRQLAYTKRQRGQRALWVRQMATGSEIQLVPPQASLNLPKFSADGSYVFFSATDSADRTVSLYRIPALGGAPRRLRTLPAGSFASSVSPDGRQVAFGRMNRNPQSDQLVVADINGTGERTVVKSAADEGIQDFAWSPDGERLAVAFYTETRGRDVFTLKAVAVADGRVTAIGTTRWSFILDLAWFGDGRGLVMNAAQEATDAKDPNLETRQVWAITYPEGRSRRVTNNTDSHGDVALSADGTTLVTSQERSRSRLWMAPAGNLGARQEVRDLAGGSRPIASGPSMIISSSGSLWTMRMDGTSPAPLTPDTLRTWDAAVSLPARIVVFDGYQSDGVRHLWRMDLDGGNPRPITTGDGEFLRALSPDGSTVLFFRDSDSRTIWRMPATGGDASRFLDETIWTKFSPDGQRLLALQIREDAGRWHRTLAVIPAAGGPPLQVWQPPPQSFGFNWAPDGSAVDFLHDSDGIRNIWRMAIGGGAMRQLTTLTESSDQSSISTFAWTTDATRLFYSVSETVSLDLVLIKNFRPDGKTP